jgi:uncharacterized protein HemX
MFAAIGALISAVISTAPTWGPIALAGYGIYQSQQQQQKAQKSAEKKAAAAQEKQTAFQKFLAGEQSALTAQQMRMQQGQYEIERLTSKIESAGTPEPRILTLPAAAPRLSIVDQVNNEIHRFVKGLG